MENVGEICGVCGMEWEEVWLDCGSCGEWFHTDCVGYEAASVEEIGEIDYICDLCTKL